MSAFLNRYCTSIAPYPGAFISLISTHRRLIYSSAPVSPFWRTQVVLASIRLFAAVFLTTLKRRGCSILRYMTTVVHLVCFSRVLRAAHVDPVRVHKRSPTLANHAFHCSQVASRAITVAVCGRSGCSSRLHSGYSSKIVRSSRSPRPLLSFLSRPGGGNTSAAAYCCIWQAYVTAFGLAPGLTGQRLPFTSWLIGSVTRRHCGAVSLSRSLLTIVSSFYISPVDSCCSTIGMRTPRCTCIQSPVACV